MNLQAWSQHAEAHANLRSTHPPVELEQRAIYGMLVALDFECHKYGDAPESTEAEVREYLKEHSAVALTVPPPSFIGLLAGTFSFLREDELKEEK